MLNIIFRSHYKIDPEQQKQPHSCTILLLLTMLKEHQYTKVTCTISAHVIQEHSHMHHEKHFVCLFFKWGSKYWLHHSRPLTNKSIQTNWIQWSKMVALFIFFFNTIRSIERPSPLWRGIGMQWDKSTWLLGKYLATGKSANRLDQLHLLGALPWFK